MTTWRSAGAVRRPLFATGIVATYVLLAFAGRELGRLGNLSVWYPPAGVAFAVGAVLGPWTLVPLAIGELLSRILVFDLDETFTATQLMVHTVGYAGIYVATATVVRRIGPAPHDAVDLRNRLPLLFSGIAVAAPAAACFGIAVQRAAGQPQPGSLLTALGVWWVGDAIGVANVGTVIYVGAIALAARRRGGSMVPRSLRRDSPVTVATLLAAPGLLAAGIFAVRPEGIAFVALLFVPMTLVALRYGGMGAAAAGLVIGPFVTAVANRHSSEALVARTDLQVVLLSAVVVSLVVGAVVDERERTSRHDRERSEIVEGMTDLVALAGRDGRLRYLNPAGRRLLGLGPDDSVLELTEEDFAHDESGAGETTAARESAAATGTWVGETRLRGREGTEVLGAKRVLTHRNDAGETVRWSTLVRDITEERRLELALARAAIEDALTGLSNRAHMVALAEETIDACRAGRGSAPLLLVKIDRIAMLMGALGIELADEMLREVARRLVGLAGPSVRVARLEGVTFGLLSEEPWLDDDGLLLANRIVDAIRTPFALSDRSVPITCSVGVAIVDASTTVAEVIRAADVAAVRAQEQGGSRVVRHEATMSEGASDRLALEAALDAAVRERTWRLDYQPIADLQTGEVVAVEALLRFGGDLPTYPLVLLAEANGLIVPLGRDLLEQACRTVVSWGTPLTHLDVHINVSGRQLTTPGFVDQVAEVLQATGIEPGRVTLELTETAVIDDLAAASDVIGDLVALGVRTALDDFGTGQSSLRVLSTLSFDIVKLDHFLTMDVVTSERARSVVVATVGFAQALDLIVVAEGVEDLEQLDVLRDLGCDQMQGWVLSAALPEAEAARRFARTASAADQAL